MKRVIGKADKIQCKTRQGKETYACQLQDFGGEVLQYGSNIYSSFSADTHLVLCVLLEETLDTAAGELQEGRSALVMF